jgi:hypothetical protein
MFVARRGTFGAWSRHESIDCPGRSSAPGWWPRSEWRGSSTGILGVAAEGRSLEDIATPLSAVRAKVSDATAGLRSATSPYDRKAGDVRA